MEFLDFTSVTLDEFQQLVPPFEEAFQAHMAAWRMDGKPQTARRFTVELVASFVNRSNFLKSWEKTETCEGNASGAYGPKNVASHAFPPHTLPRSPTIFLPTPLSYDAVALHLGPWRDAAALPKTRNQFMRF
jgi:hypothetical protein